MTKPAVSQFDSQIIAVLHGAGGRYNVLVAKTNGHRPRILDTRVFTRDEVSGLDAWLDGKQVGQVLAVLPGSNVVCRTCTLPKSDPVQLDQALQLQTEAHIASLAPKHRLASAVLHAAPDETMRCGLMIAWPESSTLKLPETTRPMRLTSDVVCLASLLNGQRPADPLIWLDRENGALALALTHANGAVFRCTCEDAESSEAWQLNVGRAITETGLNVGHSDLFLDDVVRDVQGKIATLNGTPAGLILPDEIRTNAATRVDGAGTEPDWWMNFGIATGALLARCDQLQPLTQIQVSPPIEKPSVFRTAHESMSRQNVAITCVSICLFVLLFGPMIVHGLRLGILKLRFDDIQSQLVRVENLQKKRDMYAELVKLSWPMTKLLADFSTNTPFSIELNSIRITYGDNISVSGVAKPYREGGQDLSATEVIAQMQKNLEDSNIFTDTTLNWDEPNNFGHYEFSLSTRIARPYRIARYDMEHDFALRTMQQRVDNEMPGGSDVLAASDDGPASTNDPPMAELESEPLPSEIQSSNTLAEADPVDATEPRRGRRTGSNDREGVGISRQDDRGESSLGLPPSVDIPEPLSQAQLDAMSLEEAQAMLKVVADARRHGRVDDETSERLKNEFTMLIQHIAKLRGQR